MLICLKFSTDIDVFGCCENDPKSFYYIHSNSTKVVYNRLRSMMMIGLSLACEISDRLLGQQAGGQACTQATEHTGGHGGGGGGGDGGQQ